MIPNLFHSEHDPRNPRVAQMPEAPPPVTRIIVAHAQTIIRDGLKLLIRSQLAMQVLADAADGPGLLQLAEEYRPDVVLLDVALPGINGIDVARQISRKLPEVRVLLLAAEPNGRAAAAGLQAGAMGYLDTNAASGELVRAIQTIMEGRTFLSGTVANLVMDQYVRRPEEGDDYTQLAQLTPRQHQILQMVAEGHTTKQIAMALKISPKTVDTHRKELMARLHLDSIAKLTKLAVRAGLTTLAF